MIRIGEGWDIHPLAFGRPLVLGGFVIEDVKGARGHSDADCLTHAIIDAILGAAGLGDIGHHFPDDDDTYKDARSIELLQQVGKKIHKLGFAIYNIDATVCLQAPKLESIKSMIVQNIADALNIQPFQVNVKAKTGEGLGPVGNHEAIECRAVCLVEELDAADVEEDKPARAISISIPMDDAPIVKPAPRPATTDELDEPPLQNEP